MRTASVGASDVPPARYSLRHWALERKWNNRGVCAWALSSKARSRSSEFSTPA